MAGVGAVVAGRWTYEAADTNPWGVPCGGNVHGMGGAGVIRQALDAGLVDELTIIVAPVGLGGGKRLFAGFDARCGWSTWAFASRRTRRSSTTGCCRGRAARYHRHAVPAPASASG